MNVKFARDLSTWSVRHSVFRFLFCRYLRQCYRLHAHTERMSEFLPIFDLRLIQSFFQQLQIRNESWEYKTVQKRISERPWTLMILIIVSWGRYRKPQWDPKPNHLRSTRTFAHYFRVCMDVVHVVAFMKNKDNQCHENSTTKRFVSHSTRATTTPTLQILPHAACTRNESDFFHIFIRSVGDCDSVELVVSPWAEQTNLG